VYYWTEDEARSYLPRLRGLLALLLASAQARQRARGNGHATVAGATSPSGPDTDAADTGTDGADTGTDAADTPTPGLSPAEALAEIDAKGIVLRDVDAGIVDFPSLHPSGREVHLCWRRGEDDLGFWHLPDAGFAARRPLPLPPEL